MDLHRVVTAAGDITKELPYESIKDFMQHADKDFDKTDLDERETNLREELRVLFEQLNSLQDPHKRLRWTENVMTVRCRL